MITNEVYQKALEIVNAYHEQIRLEALEIKEILQIDRKQKFRDLEEVEAGDYVKCVSVHSASSYTRDRDYEVLRTNDYQLEIMNDNGKKKWMGKSNGHFKLI